jgi:hypothetical protein
MNLVVNFVKEETSMMINFSFKNQSAFAKQICSHNVNLVKNMIKFVILMMNIL